MEIIIAVAVVAFLIGGGIYGHYIENKAWNGGYCSYCGSGWIRFDVDSQGGRDTNVGIVTIHGFHIRLLTGVIQNSVF